MSKDRSLVRASDIGLWAFCHRAWWLANVQQTPHQNPAILAYGQEAHRAHGRTLLIGQQLFWAGLFLIGLALLAALVFVALWLLA